MEPSSRLQVKALILSGGRGTRLRPFTFSVPKPLIEFVNKPIIVHQIDALLASGVTEIILAVSYQSEMLQAEITSRYKHSNLKIIYSIDPPNTPLGTGGAIALAEPYLKDVDAFYVLNSDVICDYPFDELLHKHLESKGEGMLIKTPVAHPEKYGTIVQAENEWHISEFLEKSSDNHLLKVNNFVNAGIYVFAPSVLKRFSNFQGSECSLEKNIFPQMVQDKQLGALVLAGYWMDIGQPKDYLLGQEYYLNHHSNNRPLIHPTAKIGLGCEIGPSVSIGSGVVVQDCVRITNSTLLEGVFVGSGKKSHLFMLPH